MSTTVENIRYKPLIPRTKQWPIVKLSRGRKAFMRRIAEESYRRILDDTPTAASLRRLLEHTIYKEKERVAHYNWKIDNVQKEGPFWKDCEQQLFLPIQDEKEEKKRCEKLLQRIIFHYTQEMMGRFRRAHYHIVKHMAVSIFMRLLNAVHMPIWSLLRGKRLRLSNKISAIGHVKHVRKLARKGILLILPTHFSHMDPLVVGWIISHIGLPPLVYGAGINLFNMRFFAYFMHRAGAYKIDRRKKGLIYLETLKTFTKGIVKYGCHSLFFPGGTRSRTGGLETKLKLGLLSTAITAQREFYQENKTHTPSKVFIVPVVINYHFVLEAPSLIRNYLKRSGKDRYYNEQDGYSTPYKIFRFLLTFFTKGSNISISLGRGLDVLGNYVNDKGESIDKQGKILDVRDYFLWQNKTEAHLQREQEYTRRLGARIIEEFRYNNQVLCSHVVAFAAFEMITKQYPGTDLYSLLRLPDKDICIPYADFEKTIAQLQKRIHELQQEGKLQYEQLLDQDPATIIRKGIAYCGMYHSIRPLTQKKRNGDIGTQDLHRLYYYHNRLLGYGLEGLF